MTGLDLYYEAPKAVSTCRLCLDAHIYYQKNRSYRKPYYYKAFEKVDIFRGNDRYLGRICKACIKAGRLGEMA